MQRAEIIQLIVGREAVKISPVVTPLIKVEALHQAVSRYPGALQLGDSDQTALIDYRARRRSLRRASTAHTP